ADQQQDREGRNEQLGEEPGLVDGRASDLDARAFQFGNQAAVVDQWVDDAICLAGRPLYVNGSAVQVKAHPLYPALREFRAEGCADHLRRRIAGAKIVEARRQHDGGDGPQNDVLGEATPQVVLVMRRVSRNISKESRMFTPGIPV